jgi:hypothetical protein
VRAAWADAYPIQSMIDNGTTLPQITTAEAVFRSLTQKE